MLADIDLVIFDCDGVLVDSEPISNRIWVECLRELGWPHDLETSHRLFVGRRMDDCIRIVEETLNIIAPTTLLPDFRRRSFDAFRRELQPIPGVTDVLQELAAMNIRRCVASSGPHEKIRLNLSLTGLNEFFGDDIFSGDDVARGKPHPDLFLHAAARLATDPSRCLVVEDSRPGVDAGLAAGMRVVHFDPAAVHPPGADENIVRVRSMRELTNAT